MTVYADIPDGSVFRNHPELGVSADRSDDAVRLAFILYYDDILYYDVEVVNALGAFTGVHKHLKAFTSGTCAGWKLPAVQPWLPSSQQKFWMRSLVGQVG